MHVRFSTVVGLPVVEDSAEEMVATVSGILINPDIGKVEGFFVTVRGFLQSQELFLSVQDILHWGSRVRIRDHHALAPLEDMVRLETLVAEGRTVLGQKIITENNAALGTCKDVQFDTVHFYLEWMFPKRFFRWARPIPVSSIVLVRSDAVIVRDAVTLPEAVMDPVPTVLGTLDPLGSNTAQRTMDRRRH